MSQENSSNKTVEVDLLTEDVPIRGQEWGVYSFISPDNIKGCNVRAFKNRGNFGTQEEASNYAEKIRNEEPAFHVFVGENFKWTAFDPDPNLVQNNANYYERELQTLMKGSLENQEKAKQLEAKRKRDMIEEAIKEEIKKKSDRKESTKDRLKKKLDERKRQDDKVDNEVTHELSKHKSSDKYEPVKLTDEQLKEKKENVNKLSENISSIDENLEKMKKLYADLLKKKEAKNSA